MGNENGPPPEAEQFKDITNVPPPKKAKVSKTRMKNQNLRAGLPTIDSFEKTIVVGVDGPAKVVIRLEQLMGSTKVRLNDSKYVNRLIEKMDEEEDHQWEKRKSLREIHEIERIRHLAIIGEIKEPFEEFKHLEKHPVFRVNRILNRLSKIDESMKSEPNKLKQRRIRQVEPFHEDSFLDSGILFGFHKQHYKKVPAKIMEHLEQLKRSKSEDRIVVGCINEEKEELPIEKPCLEAQVGLPIHEEEEMSIDEEEEAPVELSIHELKRPKSPAPSYDGEDSDDSQSESQTTTTFIETDENEEEDEEEPLTGTVPVKLPEKIESEQQQSNTNIIESTLTRTNSLSNTQTKELIRRGSFPEIQLQNEAKNYIEKKWTPRKAPWIEKLYDPTVDHDAVSMYKYANDLLNSYKRERLAANNLAGKYLRRTEEN